MRIGIHVWRKSSSIGKLGSRFCNFLNLQKLTKTSLETGDEEKSKNLSSLAIDHGRIIHINDISLDSSHHHLFSRNFFTHFHIEFQLPQPCDANPHAQLWNRKSTITHLTPLCEIPLDSKHTPQKM